MNKISGHPLNMEAILNSGQSFRWQKVNDFFYGVVGDQVIEILPHGPDSFSWQTYPKKNNHQLVAWHLNLDKNYSDIIEAINRDPYMAKAIDRYWGLRELRQPLFETLISFIISANNGVKLITRSVDLICRHWGEKIKVKDLEFYSFPKPEVLATISLPDLLKVSRIGFRAKSVLAAAKKVAAGEFVIESLCDHGPVQASTRLQDLHGVGPKVADCVCLFGLGHNEIIPFDVWMKRVFVQVYGQPAKARYPQLQEFARGYFGPYAGWAHQFLFMYSREHGIDDLKSAKKKPAFAG